MQRPKIIICRHAESVEDVDKTIYSLKKDLEIPLTEKGIGQANAFGLALAQILKGSSRVKFYTSPGVRNIQTLKIVLQKLPNVMNIEVEVEPLIVKQDWGKITEENRPAIEAERYSIGVLRYTFSTGESAESMISRLKLFRDKIFAIQNEVVCDMVVFSHGFEFRVLLMIIFGWEEEFFESFGNLSNCEYRILTRVAAGQYEIDVPLRKHGNPITRLKNKS